MANSSTPAGSGRTGAGFLFFLSFCLVSAGVGFAAAPHYSWTVTKIARQVTALGLQNGMLVVGGVILFGLAVVARSRPASASSEPREDESSNEELHLLNEQVSAKFSQTRTALLQLSEGQRTLAAQLQVLQQKAEEHPVHDSAPNQGQDALFRLAASLDKLNAHFDERIHGIDLQLRSGLEALTSELRRVRSDAPAVHAAPPAPVRHEPARGHAPASMAPEGAIDFYETMQKLDAIAGEAEETGHSMHPGPQPQAPFGSPSRPDLDSLLPEEYR